ncbi:uncharacterized protein EV422DRAFT_534387 [Fimicolochytrium jonesii]|uniref:uncharacterized protein n=1 Tax=Fimicolochytrium jonesii TaxID=1396493 RepID=UPI0022FE66F3|nr:uncharacterized protein EV422DRAFT_534387 [Fimicolochytrium jonesii]KAI8819337.1 hypothetical protein EV422DRAFT_534387 [Fimicolochytrium jonesii]
MPRYQPLSLDPSESTPHRRSKTAFYCGWCGDVIIQLFDSISHKFPSRIAFVGYLSGGLFAVAWWTFIDGLTYARTRPEPLPVSTGVEDWIPGILSTLALIIVNLIDREMLNSEGDGSFGGPNIATRARGCAFVGVSIALGSLGGGFAVTFLKYILQHHTSGDEAYLGYCITLQNILIFASSMILWFGRNSGNDSQAFPGY